MVFLDILQSYIIKGAIILIILQAMFLLQGLLNEHTEKANLEAELSTSSFTFSSDIRQAGYDSASTGIDTTAFTIAETSRVEFKGNIDNTGLYETIRYYLTVMPDSLRKFNLQRTVNGGTAFVVGRNFRKFYLTYFDASGNTIPLPASVLNLKKIKSISIQATMENSIMFRDDYLRSSWQAKVFPSTLNR